ncbi:MAG: hypothetical protein ACOC5R_00890, partial [Elusimicrobiota bacterium]
DRFQGNLIPQVIELESSRAELLSQNLDNLKKYGLFMENFGPRSFKINAVPVIEGRFKGEEELKDMIDEIVDTFEQETEYKSISDLNEEIVKIISCRASIKAGDKMNNEEIETMIDMLNKCEVPHRCPHGRPVIIRISEKELDSKFKR